MEDILFKGRRDLFTAGLEEYAERHTSKGPELVQRLERETAQLPSKVMLSDRCVERFLKILAATLRPALAVDVGTFTGHSALAIAEGLPDGSKVITCEIDAKQAEVARGYFKESPHHAKIDLRVAPALATLRAIDQPIGLAFIDGEKSEYWAYYDVIIEKLAPTGLIIVDNTLMFGGVLIPDAEASALHPLFQRLRRAIVDFNQRVQDDPRSENALLTVSDGLTVIRRAS
jgi:caffeoyl-CoA O-methyltransferase